MKVTLLAALVVAVVGLAAAVIPVGSPVVGVLNAAVTPVGRPVTAKLTVPLKPFWPLTLRVLLPLPACGTVRLGGRGCKAEAWGLLPSAQ